MSRSTVSATRVSPALSRSVKTAQISTPWSKAQGEAAGSQTAKDTGMAKNSVEGFQAQVEGRLRV